MAYAPTPKFTQQQDQPIVIQNRVPRQEAADVTGSFPGSQGSTVRLFGTTQGNNATMPSYGSSSTYPANYTGGIPSGVDTISGPGARYSGQSNTQQPANPGGNSPTGGDKNPTTGTGGKADWINPNLVGGSPRNSGVDWGKYYTAPVNNPGASDPNDIGRAIGWGQQGGWDPNTPSPGTTGTKPGDFAPRDGGNLTVGNPAGMQTSRMATQSDQAMYHTQGTPPPPGTTATGGIRGGSTNGGGGSPYLGPPGLGGGGSQPPTGNGRPWGTPPDYSQYQRGPLADQLRGRVGYYHPGTGISTAGSPYANPGYGNPAGIWNPGYQAPSWMGGGYRGGSGGGGGNPGGGEEPPPRQDPGGNVMAGGMGMDYQRLMDSGSNMGPVTRPPAGKGSSGGGSGGGFSMAGGMGNPSYSRTSGYTGGYQYPGGDTLSGPGAGPYSPGGGPGYQGPPNQVPPYPTFDPSNPPTPEALLQMVRDWWAQWQAANPGGGPGPNFPGRVPTGATGVQSVYPPGAWQRMQAIWPPGRRDGGGQDTGGPGQDKNPGTGQGQDPNPGYTPPTYTPPDPRPPWGGEPGGGGNPGWPGPTPGGPWTSPVMTGGWGYDYLRSQRPGSGPGR